MYGVRVEIPTEAPKISHIDTRSYHPWHARGPVLSRLSDSGGCQPRSTVHMPDRRCPVKTANPPVGGTETKQRRTVPFRGAKDRALVTGRRDVGEPLVRPVKASPSHCPSRRPPTFYASSDLKFDRWPAGREIGAAVPGSGEPGERTCSLSAAPSPAREPVKAVSIRGAAEGVLLADQLEHLGVELPCSGVSPLQREVGPSTVASGPGLGHARSCRPVEHRPPARVIAI